MKYILGLDLGTNSIGWACLRVDQQQQPIELLACNSRIFQEAVEAKTRTSKNQKRQEYRSGRKLQARRKQRKRKLLQRLVEYGFLPKNEQERQEILTSSDYAPYSLRAKALQEALTPYELGRVFFHLNQRRGFQSNRNAKLISLLNNPEITEFIKVEEGKEKPTGDEGKIKKGISELKKAMQQAEQVTLGAYLATQNKKRGKYTERSMYKSEFAKICTMQQQFAPDLLNDAQKSELANIIFFQRPLKSQRHLVGNCTFEHHHKRAAKARLEFQEFRILQKVNDLCQIDPITGEKINLNDNQRQKIIEKLQQQKSMSFDKLRKFLGLHDGEKFNLETDNNKKLLGNQTSYELDKITKKKWQSYSDEKQQGILDDLFSICRKDTLYNRLSQHWQLPKEMAYQLAIKEFEQGYADLSLRALRKLLPQMRAGLNYHDACQAVGYQRIDQRELPVEDFLPQPDDLRNPVVNKALHETRKLVNAIIRRYGKPENIRVELARELKLTKKKLNDFNKQQKNNNKANEDAVKTLLEHKIFTDENRITENDKLKYRLWKEAKEHCPYTGEYISLPRLYSGEIQIEHIIPYSRCLDNSYMNKTICLADDNRFKNNKTPYECYAGTMQYDEIKQRIKHFPSAKQKRFFQQNVELDDFVSRQLNDTRYISKAMRNYLLNLGCTVECVQGSTTAFLRNRWGVNNILGDGNTKDRRDHRHHALDAIIIALTTKRVLNHVASQAADANKQLTRKFVLHNIPWPTFKQDVTEKLQSVIVSHANSLRIRGELHEASYYGYDKGKKVYLKRIPLSDIKEDKKIEKIQDDAIRKLVREHVAKFSGDFKTAFSNDNLPKHYNGSIITSVRMQYDKDDQGMITIDSKKAKQIYYVPSGNNHHMEIFQHTQTKQYQWRMVSRFEAAQRCRKKQPIINKQYEDLHWQYVMYLAINDLVQHKETNKIYRVQKLSFKKIVLQPHTFSLADYVKGNSVAMGKNTSEQYRKIAVNRLGEIV